MKVMISGKGGSGKSTVATMLAKSLVSDGYRVLVIDADESIRAQRHTWHGEFNRTHRPAGRLQFRNG